MVLTETFLKRRALHGLFYTASQRLLRALAYGGHVSRRDALRGFTPLRMALRAAFILSRSIVNSES